MRESEMAPENHPNHLLASLPKADFELIHPYLKPITLDAETTLFSTGDTLERVYFPHSGIISLVVDLASGEMIEAAMVGRDSMVGAASALDGQISLNKAIVQLAGAGSTLEVSRFRKLADQSASLRITLIRHEETLFAQAQQSVACNATHTLEARLARWLLRARDLADDNSLDLTQEFLSQMLGVGRPSVSVVANTLQKAGLIDYNRGHIKITNADGLRDAACECYETVKRNYDRLLNNSK
jgi:CRP-like cAMP-binding protein